MKKNIAAVFAFAVLAALAAQAAKAPIDYVDLFVGTEGAGTQYGGVQPDTCVPFGSFHLVPVMRPHRFLLARDSESRKDFGKIAMDLLDYRIGIVKRLSDSWGRVFRSNPAEVKWWRKVPREVIEAAYPEIELND